MTAPVFPTDVLVFCSWRGKLEKSGSHIRGRCGQKRTKVQTKQNIVFPEKEKSDGPRKGHSQSPLFSTGKKSTFHILE